MTILTTTAGLFNIFPFGISRAENRFAIRDLWLTHVSDNAELALHSFNENFEVEFAHAGYNRFSGFFIARDAEGRIFVRKLSERNTHFLLIGFRLRFDA